MKRLLSISLFAVACAALVSPEPAHAGKHGKHGKHGKSGKNGKNGKHGKHGKHGHDDDDDGHHHDDDDDGGGGGGSSASKGRVSGAGQRGVASFGGTIVSGHTGVRGIFLLDVHPIAPSGTTALSTACRFTRFENFVIAGNRATFRAFGKCRILRTDGTIDITDNVNDFQIVDNAEGDVIDVDNVGPGFAVSGGPIAFGDLTVTSAS